MQTASAPFKVSLNNVIQSFRAHREYEEFLLNWILFDNITWAFEVGNTLHGNVFFISQCQSGW